MKRMTGTPALVLFGVLPLLGVACGSDDAADSSTPVSLPAPISSDRAAAADTELVTTGSSVAAVDPSPDSTPWRFRLVDQQGWAYDVTVSGGFEIEFEKDVSTSPPGLARFSATVVASTLAISYESALQDRTPPPLQFEISARFDTAVNGSLEPTTGIQTGCEGFDNTELICWMSSDGLVLPLPPDHTGVAVWTSDKDVEETVLDASLAGIDSPATDSIGLIVSNGGNGGQLRLTAAGPVEVTSGTWTVEPIG